MAGTGREVIEVAVATLRGRRLANELRQLREAAGLTLDDAAKEALISKSALSRIENALVTPRPLVLRSLCQAYNVPNLEAERLADLGKAASQPGWWHTFADQLKQGYSVFIGFESEAIAIKSYEPLLVPGLLQTKEYAEAISRAAERTDEETELGVAARMRRQERIKEMDLSYVIEESTLRRIVGGPDVMTAQLKRLLEFSYQPKASLQVVLEGAGGHIAMDGQFGLLEFGNDFPTVAFAETQAGQIWIEESTDIERLIHVFDKMTSTALDVEATRDVIRRHIGG